MSFTQGFEKTADVAGMLGKAKGTIQKGITGAKRGVSNFLAAKKQSFRAGHQAAFGRAESKAGEGLANRAADKAKTLGAPQSPAQTAATAKYKGSEVKDRAKRMGESKANNKKSFAGKHPFLTAGGLYLGARYALGGGEDKKQSQAPQVTPGGQY